MNEIAPGIFHWDAVHPDINMRVSGYYIEPAGVLIDPLEPEDGMAFFDDLALAPQQVVLTSGLHWRHSDRFAERYGATVRVVQGGIDRWRRSGEEGREAEPFEFGDEIAPGVIAREVGGIAPDDTALQITHGPGALAFADAVIAYGGEIGFVPDNLMDEPEPEKAAIRDSVRGLLTHDFEVLLFAHGEPVPKDGHNRLTEWVNGT